MFVNHVISDIYLGFGKGSASLSRIYMFHAKITSNHIIYNLTLEDANTTTISWQVSPTYSIVNFGWVEHYCCSCGCFCRCCCLNYRISALVACSGACQTKIPPQQAGENFEVRVRPVSDEHKNQETWMHWSRCVGVFKRGRNNRIRDSTDSLFGVWLKLPQRASVWSFCYPAVPKKSRVASRHHPSLRAFDPWSCLKVVLLSGTPNPTYLTPLQKGV